jgi:SAM-dependent methyltransferase
MMDPVTVRFSPLLGLSAIPLRWAPSLRYLLRRQRILALLDKLPIGAVLEIGCGAGALLVDFVRRGHKVSAVETSADAFRLAQRITHAAGIDVALYPTLEQLPLGEMFGLVCAFDVLEHIEEDAIALRVWADRMRPDGKLLISVPAHSSRWGAGDIWAGHFRRYNAIDLRTLFARCGLKIEYMECYGFPLANLSEYLGEAGYRRALAQQPVNDKSTASAASGIDRSSLIPLFAYINSFPGRLALRVCFALQTIFRKTSFGSGYLVLASLT